MREPIWVLDEAVTAIHHRQIAEHGGLPGVRDTGALASGLSRPKNKFAYETPTLFELAAAHAYGVAANHPFNDGNKRTAYVVSLTFLRLNGFRVTATQEDKYRTFVSLAAGTLTESELAVWFKKNAEAVK
jgi:death-on-curing protein